MLSDQFFLNFENEFRGSRHLIKSRLQVYLPFVLPCIKLLENPRALDLGCGRGEWLEIMQENKFTATGIDLNVDKISACANLGFKVIRADITGFLINQPDAYYSVISGFHIAEHMTHDTLYSLIQEALRVLVPGGILILETPNPENILVSTNTFYLDPTHLRPLPPGLLAFMTKDAGFCRNKIVRLQQCYSPEKSITLSDVFRNVSPDYAIVAQKPGAKSMVDAAFNVPFSREYGVSLLDMLGAYDKQMAIAYKICNIMSQIKSKLRFLKRSS